VLTVVQVGVVLAFALAGPFWLAVAAVWAYGLSRSVAAPVSATWLNQQITDSRVRATVISLDGQSDAFGQILGGPGVGALGSLMSLRAALVAGAVLLVPAIGLYGRALRHGGVEPELDELPTPTTSPPRDLSP
jgi:DHA3 family tetracycline resistance protein-like MFS transporter